MKYGCIAEKLSHSFSREIHQKLGDYPYELKELTPQELVAFMEERCFSAINVTIPYKRDVIPFLDELEPTAAAVGAVNTVVNKNGRLYGYNTDVYGMRALIRRLGVSLVGCKVLILGSGGTAQTARTVAKELGAACIYAVSRGDRGDCTYEEAAKLHADVDFIINTTPCGMYPKFTPLPLDLADFPALCGVVDAVYNPLRTAFVSQARERGLPAAGGLYMLVAQAARASEYFLETSYPEERVEEVYRSVFASKQNIVLIGMPGSGKTTVGKALAKQLGHPFLDTDRLFAERFGVTPADCIRAEGESAFRSKESALIASLTEKNGCVIATGGGAVLREENLRALRANGRLYFLDRPLEALLPTEDRPLTSDRAALEQRYHERHPVYRVAADCILHPASVEAACREIMEDMSCEDFCD